MTSDAQLKFDQSTVLLLAEIVAKLHALDARVSQLEGNTPDCDDCPHVESIIEGARDAYD